MITANTMPVKIATTRKGVVMVDCMRTSVNSILATHDSSSHLYCE